MVTNGVLSLLEQSQRSFRILTNFCACRTPSFADQLIEADNGLGEVMKPPEKSFWAKYVSNCTKYLLYFVQYLRVCVCVCMFLQSDLFVLQWMYIIPLGLIVMNAVTAAANIPEEAAGQGQPGAERAPAAAAGRRR